MGRERWEGGYIHRQKDGRPLYIIEREWQGRRFHISTRCHSARAAYEHLRRFEADPLAYEREQKEAKRTAEGLTLTTELVADFYRWMLHRPVPATKKHANEMGNRLADWAEDLAGQDLRNLDLATLKRCLDRRKSRQHRIIALKAFFSWLREERHLVRRTEDVTLDLRVPQAVPEKHRRRKAVELERVRAALGHLVGPYRDMLLLACATGWHTTELERFIRDPSAELLRQPEGAVPLAVLVVRHKSGDLTRTPLSDAEALAAAERLKARGKVPKKMNEALAQACDAAEVPRFTLGVMRHTVATWAVERGSALAAVAEFLGHKDARTTRRFYADVAAPTVQVRLPSLRVVPD